MFSTKERRPLITPALRERLWPFLGGIARQNKMQAVEIGGVSDHVHLLLSLPATRPIAKAMQLIKGGSSKWVHETFPEHRLFAWQEQGLAIPCRCHHLAVLLSRGLHIAQSPPQ